MALRERTTPEVRITVARTLEELEQLRGPWNELLGPQLNADPDYFVTAIRGRDDAVRPHVLLLEHAGEPRALAVGRVEEITLPCKFGYRTVYAPSVRALTVVYEGLLGDPSVEDTELVFGELRAALGRGEADVLRLRNLEVDSTLHRLATRTPSVLARQHTSTTSVHWELALPDTLDELLQSKSSSFRKDTRYDERRLAKEFGDRLTVEVYREPSDLERLFGQIADVSATTYQRGLGVAFGDRELDRTLTKLAAERGWFRAYVLSIDGEPRAFWHGVAHGGRFNLGTPGYDPAYGRLRIGNFLLMRLLDDVCADPSVELFDFGFGDAFYKQRLGDRKKLEEDVLVFASSFRGARVNLTRTAVLKAAGVARAVAERAPALQGLKRKWRSRLSAGATR